ncbi:DUF2188 domain-containing protein [Nocardia brasiliensis]|uniref:DUF2188 domain-containing protein n=1 Tax=Nocardia brasiliensis TaxID=37326 RepID=UPI002457C151|nr:DUF2188 domain-containing protein [Nocardia brasiliensis]
MAKPNKIHVQPRPDGKWEAAKPNASRASAVKPTQQEAINRGRELLGKDGGELIIHGRDGRIRDSDTIAPGNDPNPPRDTR